MFKVLGNESRLGLLRLISREPRAVSALSEASGMSQPLVSQHLRTLRQAGLATDVRHGKTVVYHLADLHVDHVIADALAHVLEPRGSEHPHESHHPTSHHTEETS
nr:metalloregulator ArsR/SmtB family transcription factor [Leucobacter weissii]